jgi:DNA-binding transcriptional LysR family regulator
MSQPAVSQAIARLERTLGLRLFERTSREVRLTQAGKTLVPYAQALLDQAAAFSAEAARLSVPEPSAIRLAYCPLIGTLAARVARRLAHHVPPIEVDLRPAGWSAATAGLAQKTASAAIMSAPFPQGLATAARFHVPVTHLAVPAGSPLATASTIRLEQVPRHEILLPRALWAQVTARLPDMSPSRAASDDLDDLIATLNLVAAGKGFLPAPNLLVETVRRPDIRYLALADAGLRMTYALVWNQERASAELMTLVRTVQEILRNPGRAIK